MKKFNIIGAFVLMLVLSVTLGSCAYDPYDPPARVRRSLDSALHDYLVNSEGMDRSEAEKFMIEGYHSIEDLTEGRIYINDKKITGEMYIFTDDIETFMNCYAVNISNKEIYRKMSNTDGASSPVYVKVSPLLPRATAEKLLNAVMTSSSEEYTAYLGDTFSITDEVTINTYEGVMVYGLAVPEYGDYNQKGTLLQESNIIVYDADPGHVLYSSFFTGGGYSFLGTTSGTNAFGGTVTVYEFGTPMEAKQALWNYNGASGALENLAEYYD